MATAGTNCCWQHFVLLQPSKCSLQGRLMACTALAWWVNCNVQIISHQHHEPWPEGASQGGHNAVGCSNHVICVIVLDLGPNLSDDELVSLIDLGSKDAVELGPKVPIFSKDSKWLLASLSSQALSSQVDLLWPYQHPGFPVRKPRHAAHADPTLECHVGLQGKPGPRLAFVTASRKFWHLARLAFSSRDWWCVVIAYTALESCKFAWSMLASWPAQGHETQVGQCPEGNGNSISHIKKGGRRLQQGAVVVNHVCSSTTLDEGVASPVCSTGI